jgi:hypothetical protein
MNKAAMSEMNGGPLKKILAFSSLVEIGTGVVLIIDPAIVVMLLLGADVAGVPIAVARCFGIALFALGLACWPGSRRAQSGSPVVQALLIYNGLIALYLAYLGTIRHLDGLLLWPGVALHAVVALLLMWMWRGRRQTQTSDQQGRPLNVER